MNIFRKIILVFAAVSMIAFPVSAFAATDACTYMQGNAGKSSVCGGGKTDLKTTVKNVINTLLWVVGVAAVIVIIFSGILYVISSGDSGRINKAKNALIYAVVGLVVAVMSYAIVNFVIGNIL